MAFQQRTWEAKVVDDDFVEQLPHEGTHLESKKISILHEILFRMLLLREKCHKVIHRNTFIDERRVFSYILFNYKLQFAVCNLAAEPSYYLLLKVRRNVEKASVN